MAEADGLRHGVRDASLDTNRSDAERERERKDGPMRRVTMFENQETGSFLRHLRIVRQERWERKDVGGFGEWFVAIKPIIILILSSFIYLARGHTARWKYTT